MPWGGLSASQSSDGWGVTKGEGVVIHFEKETPCEKETHFEKETPCENISNLSLS